MEDPDRGQVGDLGGLVRVGGGGLIEQGREEFQPLDDGGRSGGVFSFDGCRRWGRCVGRWRAGKGLQEGEDAEEGGRMEGRSGQGGEGSGRVRRVREEGRVRDGRPFCSLLLEAADDGGHQSRSQVRQPELVPLGGGRY